MEGLSHKEITEAGRLGKCLDSGFIPVKQLREYLRGIEQKGIPSAGSRVPKREVKKTGRKDHYKSKLRIAS